MTDETIPEGAVSQPEMDAAVASQAFGEGENIAQPAEATPDQQVETEAAPATEEASNIEYFDQLAPELDIDPEQLLGLKVKIKVDGEEHDVTLKDLVKVNQLEGHVNKKSIELSEQRKTFEAESAKARQEWQQRISFAGQVLDGQEAQLEQQYNAINWGALAQQDPAQYNSLYIQFQQAAQQLHGQKMALQQHWQQTMAQMRGAAKPRTLEALRAKFPELADPVTYGNTLGEIKNYLKGIGADDNSAEALELDPIVFQVARDAARYRAIVAKQTQVATKLKAAPQMEKPGAKDSFGAKHAKQAALRKRADGGDESAIAELLFSS